MQEEPVFDAAHLDRQTMGDEALRVEILALFVAEAERLLAQVESAPDQLVRASRMHAMQGLARNVGAKRLAALCRKLENSGEPDDLERLRAAVREAIEQVHAGAV
jgi:HPt (histidine-containing phosphotransfer) domain-containing protein